MAIEKEYTLKLSTEDAQKNVDELNQSLELQESLIDDLEKEIRQYEKQLEKTSKADLAAQKKIKDALKQKKEALKDEKIALKDLNKDRKKANEELKDATENAADYSGALGLVDKQTGGLVSGLKNLTGGLGGATKGMNLLKVAIIGTGIGALLIAITAVTTAFKSSEEGQNKYAKLLGVIGSVVGNLVDLLADFGETIISAFENPKQAIIDLKNSIKENITNRIESLIDTFGFLGKAIKKVFSGDFKGALEDAKSAGSSYVDSLTGVKNTIDKVTESTKGFVKELKEEAIIAGQIADKRAKADKIERKNIVDRAEANRKRAELLEKAANKEKFTAQERIEFLKEAGRLEEEITNKEIEAAKLKLEAKTSENALARSTKEDLEEEAQLKANLINLEAARLQKQKLVTSQIVAAKREEEAELKAIRDAKALEIKEAEKAETDRQAAVDKINKDLEIQKENEKAQTEIQKIELEKERKIAELDRLKATEEEKANIIAFYDGKITDAKDKNEEKQKRLKEIRTKQTLGDAKNTFNQIAQLAGEDSKVGKAFAIASATISGVEGVQNAYTTAQKSPITTFFPAYPVVSAGLAAAVAVKNIATIKKQDPSGRGASASPQRPTGTPPAASIPPAFNVVGASGTNQLADAIGGQTQQPIQAFVVSSEVTSAQELDRNIIDDASIG
jgi:chromosome segregation ATPase